MGRTNSLFTGSKNTTSRVKAPAHNHPLAPDDCMGIAPDIRVHANARSNRVMNNLQPESKNPIRANDLHRTQEHDQTGALPDPQNPVFIEDSGRDTADPAAEHDADNPANRDPISGEPGSHPVATGVGAAGAGAIGTVAGVLLGGPIGGMLGAVAGGVAGGYAGKVVGENADPTKDDDYWRTNHRTEDYDGRGYDEYAPAYRAGFDGYARYSASGRTFDEAEAEIQRDYEEQASYHLALGRGTRRKSGRMGTCLKKKICLGCTRFDAAQCERRRQVLINLFEWFHSAHGKVVVGGSKLFNRVQAATVSTDALVASS